MGLWILFSILVTTLYIGVVAFLLPELFLKNKYKVNYPQDRGIARYRLGEKGRGVAYLPNGTVRKYIQQYVIAYDGNEKNLKCMLESPLDYIEYDLVLFNNENKVFNVLNVRDVLNGAEYTRTVELPLETAYVSIVIIRADNERLSNHVKLKISWLGVMASMLISFILSIVTAFAIRLSLVNYFGGVFTQSFLGEVGGHIGTFVLAVVVSIMGIAFATVVMAIKNMFRK